MSNDGDRALLSFESNEESGQLIRRQWHDGRWFFSVIDVVGLLTDSTDPGNYWAQLKRRVQGEGFAEPVTKCHQLKMRSLDGKMRETDAAVTCCASRSDPLRPVDQIEAGLVVGAFVSDRWRSM